MCARNKPVLKSYKDKMVYSLKNKDDSKHLEKLSDLQSKKKQVRLEQKLSEQSLHCDKKNYLAQLQKLLLVQANT